jgi:hypothetical protein
MGKILLGYLNARANGQPFNHWKFWSTVVTTFFMSIIVFGTIDTVNIGVDENGFMLLIMFFLGLGFFGSDQMKNFVVGGLNKMIQK